MAEGARMVGDNWGMAADSPKGNMATDIVVAVIGVAGTSAVALIGWLAGARKTRSEIASSNFATLQSEIDRLRDDLAQSDSHARQANQTMLERDEHAHQQILDLQRQLRAHEAEIAGLRVELHTWVTGAQALTAQLKNAGFTPVFDETWRANLGDAS